MTGFFILAFSRIFGRSSKVRFIFCLGLFRFFSCFTSTLGSSTTSGLNRWLTHPFFFSGGLGDFRFPWSWRDISNWLAGVMECWKRWYSWFVLDVREANQGEQEQKHFFPLETRLYSHVNSSKKILFLYYHHGHLFTCLRTKKGKGKESLSSTVSNKPEADVALISLPPSLHQCSVLRVFKAA